MYFITNKADRYTEESNGNKYLVFASTDKIKEILSKYKEMWNKTKNVIETINDKPGEYKMIFIKIKFHSDDNHLPLGKILRLHKTTIVVRSVFSEGNKYYHNFLDECLHEL